MTFGTSLICIVSKKLGYFPENMLCSYVLAEDVFWCISVGTSIYLFESQHSVL
jgi:hypothetical protein